MKIYKKCQIVLEGACCQQTLPHCSHLNLVTLVCQSMPIARFIFALRVFVCCMCVVQELYHFGVSFSFQFPFFHLKQYSLNTHTHAIWLNIISQSEPINKTARTQKISLLSLITNFLVSLSRKNKEKKEDKTKVASFHTSFLCHKIKKVHFYKFQ